MPINKQSMAGSLFQTLTRLCTAVSYGIATAIFDAVKKNPSSSGYYANNAAEPFAAVFCKCPIPNARTPQTNCIFSRVFRRMCVSWNTIRSILEDWHSRPQGRHGTSEGRYRKCAWAR